MPQRHIPFRSTATACVLVAAALLGGCGGSHHSSAPSGAPVLRSAVARETPGRIWVFTADAFDAEGDLFNGRIVLDVDNLTVPGTAHFEAPLTEVAPGVDPHDPEADAFIVIHLNPAVPRGIPFTFRMLVFDSAGHASNIVSGSAVSEARAGEASVAGSVEGTVEVAGLGRHP